MSKAKKTIKPKPESDKKSSDSIVSKEKSTWYYYVLALLVIFGVGYFLFFSPSIEDDDLYNGFDFQEDIDGFWWVTLNTAVGDESVPFYYHPRELEQLSYDDNITIRLAQVQQNEGVVRLALGTDFDDGSYIYVSALEVGKITGRVFAMPTKSGFTTPIEDNPVFTCENASNTTFVFQFEKGDGNYAISDGYCARIVSTNSTNSIMVADLVVFKTLGVMR